MGMFDTIICEYPLPGNPPDFVKGASFQTKDLDRTLNTFTLNSDGCLLQAGACSGITAVVNFYTNNIVARGPGVYTRDGEDAQELEYKATFIDGWLSDIVEIENKITVALKFEPKDWGSDTDHEQWKLRRNESLLGRTMCIWWGGEGSLGEMGKVVAENEFEWAVQDGFTGKFRIISRWQRDRTFFDSYEDGKQYWEKERAAWAAKRAEYDAAVAIKAKQ
jgi:hypothetical protein